MTNCRAADACQERVSAITYGGVDSTNPILRHLLRSGPGELAHGYETGTAGRMDMKTDNSGKGEVVPSVRPLNPDFSFLALKAAIELDNILRGKAPSGEAIVQLAKSLRDTTAGIGVVASMSSLADPMSADLLSRAIKADTLGDLVSRANEIASSLQAAKAGSEAEGIKDLRDFCLALSQVSSAFDQEERERERPPHPHRI